jgi:hypothetical protein
MRRNEEDAPKAVIRQNQTAPRLCTSAANLVEIQVGIELPFIDTEFESRLDH